MKNNRCLFFLLLLVCEPVFVQGQVTNLVVNGSSTNFIMVSGDTIKWEYNIPIGAKTVGEVWYDVNGNGTVEPGTDVARFIFAQTDGDTSNMGGPPDLDRSANGHIIFYARAGIAPGKYVVRFTQNSVSQSVAGTATPLLSPAHTISGTVTPPAGKSAQYINVSIERESGGEPDFWDAYTDAGGNYSIQMNADTAGNPWRVRIENNPYPPSVVSPEEIPLVIAGNHSGNNFGFLQAAAQVAGTLRDDGGNPLADGGAHVIRNDNNAFRGVRTNLSGFFQIGILPNELTGQTWILQGDVQNFGFTLDELTPRISLPVIMPNDSLYRNLTVYKVNSSIQGQIRINSVPANFPIEIVALNADTAFANAFSDGATGNFSVPVSTKIYNYDVSATNLPPNYTSPVVRAHPGNTGVIIRITVTSVQEREPGVPGRFALEQNYPNPFNPATTIEYTLPRTGVIRLAIYDLLGREVATLIDGPRDTGVHSVVWQADGQASGLYLYRLSTNAGVITRKLLLLK